jgi:hypothetical protein
LSREGTKAKEAAKTFSVKCLCRGSGFESSLNLRVDLTLEQPTTEKSSTIPLIRKSLFDVCANHWLQCGPCTLLSISDDIHDGSGASFSGERERSAGSNGCSFSVRDLTENSVEIVWGTPVMGIKLQDAILRDQSPVRDLESQGDQYTK